MPGPVTCARCGTAVPAPTRRTFCESCGPLVRAERNRANQQALRERRLAARAGSPAVPAIATLTERQSAGFRDAVKAVRRSARDLTRAKETSRVWIAEIDPHLGSVTDLLEHLAPLLLDVATPRKGAAT